MNKDNNFESQVLDKIKKEDIKPKARWTFLLREYAVWAFGLLSLLVGGLAVSSIIFMARYGNWEKIGYVEDSVLEFVLLSIPYFWLILLGSFIFLVNYNIKHTKKGYKYSLPLIVLVSVFLSIALGFFFHGVGASQALDDVLSEKTPIYSQMINPQMRFWDDPSDGRLAGFVFSRNSEGGYQLVDIRRVEWLIVPVERLEGADELIRVGKPVRLMGEAHDGNVFEFERVIVHEGPGRGMMHYKIKNRMMDDPMFREKMKNMHELREDYGIPCPNAGVSETCINE